MTRTRVAVLAGVFAASTIGLAQSRRIASPPGVSATETGGRYDERKGYVDGKWLEVRYGRPIKRGRDLFGPSDFAGALNDGAPVWRAGANVSTRLVTDVPILLGGKRIAPGEYTVFIELTRNDWTLIVSTWPAQTSYDDKNKDALWGAYEYTPDRDVVRVAMRLETLPHSFDQLSWEFLDMTDTAGRLAVLWDKKLASVPFRIDGK
jgi:hypothetical protein